MKQSQSKKENPKATILIVEDHDALRGSLKTWLSSVLQGCNVLQAKSGEEALDRVFAQAPDLVLIDVVLPGMNGIEVTRRIKDVNPKTLVVMLSIYEDPAYQADAFAVGASAYVLKRKMGTELIPVINSILYNHILTAPE